MTSKGGVANERCRKSAEGGSIVTAMSEPSVGLECPSCHEPWLRPTTVPGRYRCVYCLHRYELRSVCPGCGEHQTRADGAVTLEAVAFRYQPDLPDVVQDISLNIAPGEVVALVGRSGAGKTTIASLLPRFWDVTSGRITLDGIDIRSLSLDALRTSIGIVPQEPVLFSGTIRENIAYARPDASDAELLRAAQAAHAWEFIERLPDQWNTRVGERGVKLSGGQRQRIAIARVFLKNPAVVILDEATSSLDTESERYVEQALEQLLQGRTTLLIAHRLSTVRRADRVVVLDQGRIVETGSHDELLGREDGLFARLHQLN